MSPALAHAMADERFRAIASRIVYPGLIIEVLHEQVLPHGAKSPTHCGHYLRVFCPEGRCNVDGSPMAWKGRKWRLSRHMTDMEFVNTAFMAVLTALEHEARERFLVDGVAIMDSHRDLHDVIGFMRTGGGHGRAEVQS